MASRGLDLLRLEGGYAVGNLNSYWAKPLANGAVVSEDKIENFTFVEVYFENGIRKCKYLTDAKKSDEVFLVTTPERRLPEETLKDFYNAKGEFARLHILEQSLRFESSKVTLNSGVTTVKEGFVAHFDPTSKTYIISDPTSAHSDYTTAGIKLEVVAIGTELGYEQGITVYRFEVKKIV
ncbi:phage morphogenesis protein [Clostridium botulinum]